MSHVDEGLIHAYIDGAFPPGNEQGEEIEAHIAVCVDCRVRLEKARELKERAQVVMHRLAPGTIVAPPFEEILARRERERAGGGGPAVSAKPATKPANRRRTDRFPIPFAWAATVILAVGAGWMGRELVLNRQVGSADQAVGAEAEAVTLDARAPAPQRSEAAEPAAPPPAASVAQDAAGAGRQEQPADVRRQAEATAGFAAPMTLSKAADSAAPQIAAMAVDVDSAPLVLRGIAERAPTARAARAAPGETPAGASEERVAADLTVAVAYARASAETLWVPEPYAAAGLLGYEPVARLEGSDFGYNERAVVDSMELLRTLYVLEGDTVEVVQQLKQLDIALDAVTVHGVGRADTARVSGADTARVRGDTASAAARVEAAPPPAIAAMRRGFQADARDVERARNVVDSASVFQSRSIVTIRRDGRVVLLLGRMPEETLQGIAERVR